MEIKIEKSIAKGVVVAPPSKSYAHRYLIAGALSGKAKITNISFSSDILATFNCLKALGYKLEKEGNTVICKGKGESTRLLDCKESGSTLRFMIPLCLLDDEEVTLKGTKKLFSRGLDIYLDIFKKQGIYYHLEEDSITIKGKLKPGKYAFRGDISSQFISGLCFVLPLLDKYSSIDITTKLESASYVDMTLSSMRRFGVDIERLGNHIYILGNQRYERLKPAVVEGDYSNAAFLDAFNLLGGEVEVKGLMNPLYSKQGDKIYPKYFKKLKEGCPTIDLSNNIDLGPILFTLSTLFHGAIFKGIKRLRIKESDRIVDMLTPLKEFDVRYELKEDEIKIYPIKELKSDIHLHPVNDHRIVMSLIVLLSSIGGYIDNIEAINKSYPNFLSDIERLGIGVKYYG